MVRHVHRAGPLGGLSAVEDGPAQSGPHPDHVGTRAGDVIDTDDPVVGPMHSLVVPIFLQVTLPVEKTEIRRVKALALKLERKSTAVVFLSEMAAEWAGFNPTEHLISGGGVLEYLILDKGPEESVEILGRGDQAPARPVGRHHSRPDGRCCRKSDWRILSGRYNSLIPCLCELGSIRKF